MKNNITVKLRKANRYNTYQFYAEMDNKNINLYDGLKIAALSSLSWLRSRLGDNNIPNDLLMPESFDFKKVSNKDFKSFTINDSYIFNVISDIDEGIWALRIIESDSGNLTEEEIVAGRTIQSDIGFRIAENKLECGFKTIVNDINEAKLAECIRFSLIKELANDVNFGFKQINTLYNPNNMVIEDEYKLNEVYSILNSKENQLPLIIYTYDDHTTVDLKDINLDDFKPSPISSFTRKTNKLLDEALLNTNNKKEDISTRFIPYANRYLGYARAYFLPKHMFNSFAKRFNLNQVNLDEVYVIEPFANKVNRFSYNNKEKYQSFIRNYNRNKEISFNNVLFIDDASIILKANSDAYKKEKEKQLNETNLKLEQLKTKQARDIRKNEYVAIDSNKDELIEALENLKKSEKEKVVLNNEINRLKKELQNKIEYIEYINRKQNRPKQHKDIEIWAKQFSNIILDKKAIACLNKNDAENVDVDVICDALDYLDKAYFKYLFENLSIDELNDISSNIYHRPYNVTPSGIPISARGDCKIKYAFVDEKRTEHVLDQHLKIGAHGELLRIYFIIDKDRQKIVIGSLPNHLEY